MRDEVTRKALHLLSATLPVAWGLDIIGTSTVRTALIGALGVALIIEFARSSSPRMRELFDRAVGPMLRPHEARTLTGATWLAAAMLLSVVLFPTRAAVTALWAAAVGDAAATLLGRVAAKGESGTGTKTFVGSLACVVATAVGAWWLAGASATVATAIGVAAAVAERPRLVIDDNARVALAAGAAAWGLLAA